MNPYYYTYNFISPEGIWAEIKEEMKSYFRTGIIDDTMFPIYTNNALDDLGKSSLKIDWQICELENGQAELPCDFKYIREVYACNNIARSFKLPGSYYHQKTCVVSPYGDYDRCNPCDTENSCEVSCNREYKIVLKDTREQVMTFQVAGWLRPGSSNARNHCHSDSPMFSANYGECGIFDVVGKNLVTDIPNGTVYILYYKEERDGSDYQMIPDNRKIKKYVKAYLKYKMYEQLWNETVDETSNQIEGKYRNYRAESDEAFIIAETETKKQTVEQKINSIKRTKSRLSAYKRGLENGNTGRY